MINSKIFTFCILLALSMACDERGEEGGMHGDMDMAQENSFDGPLDTPEGVSDPLDVLTEAQLRNETYLAWGVFKADEPEEIRGSVYFSEASGSLVGRVAFSGLDPGKAYKLQIYEDTDCSVSARDLEEKASATTIFLVADAEGHLGQQIMESPQTVEDFEKLFAQESIQHGVMILHEQTEDEILACASITTRHEAQ